VLPEPADFDNGRRAGKSLRAETRPLLAEQQDAAGGKRKVSMITEPGTLSIAITGSAVSAAQAAPTTSG
jgi:hypothetical protein